MRTEDHMPFGRYSTEYDTPPEVRVDGVKVVPLDDWLNPRWHRAPFIEWTPREWQLGASIAWTSTTRGGFLALGPLFLQFAYTR